MQCRIILNSKNAASSLEVSLCFFFSDKNCFKLVNILETDVFTENKILSVFRVQLCPNQISLILHCFISCLCLYCKTGIYQYCIRICFKSTNIMKTVCIIMLISIFYSDLSQWELNFEAISRQYGKKAHSNSRCVSPDRRQKNFNFVDKGNYMKCKC